MHQRVLGILLMAGACAALFAALPETLASLRWAGVGLSLLAVLGCFYFWLVGGGAVFVVSRAFVALLPVSLVAIFIIMVISLEGEAADNRIMIAAVVVAGGWIVAFITQELRRFDEREERRRDLIKALTAEIRLIVDLHELLNWDDVMSDAETAFRKDKDYVPFSVFLHETDLLRRVLNEVELLHSAQIREVYAFSQLMDKIRQIAQRLEGDAYKALSQQRKLDVYLRLLKMHGTVAETGHAALEVLQQDKFRGLFRWTE